MDVEIICVGDELVEGRVADENSPALTSALFEIGLAPYRVTLVKSHRDALAGSLENAIVRAKITIVTGGLGITPDAITREVVAELLDVELIENAQALTALNALIAARGIEADETFKRMALLPEGARVLPNRVGYAPGFALERQGRWLFVLPGVPDEALVMAREQCMEEWQSIAGGPGDFAWEIVRTSGIAERFLAPQVQAVMAPFPTMKASYRINPDGVDVLLSSQGPGTLGASHVKTASQKIREALPRQVYGFGHATLESELGSLLRQLKLRIAVAESCTGGLIGDRITSIPGSSDYFECSLVTYSNKAKEELLGIPAQLLDDYGAVSSQVARAMARGVKARLSADLGLAVTGIAGPGGGTPTKPVGTVFIAFAHSQDVVVKHYWLYGDRGRIKYQTSSLALDLARTTLLDLGGKNGD